MTEINSFPINTKTYEELDPITDDQATDEDGVLFFDESVGVMKRMTRGELFKGKVIPINSIADFASLPVETYSDRQQFHLNAFAPDGSSGGGPLMWTPNQPKSLHDGIRYFSPTVPAPADFNNPTDVQNYMDGVGEEFPTADGIFELTLYSIQSSEFPAVDGAFVLWDGVSGNQVKNGVVPSTIGVNALQIPNITEVSYSRYNADETISMRTLVEHKTDLSLNNVNNTSDADKPISTATQAALDLKANSSDVTAALALKAPLASPALTGNPTAPTQSANTNDETLANTAFVQGELTDRIQSVATIADLVALTGLEDGQRVFVSKFYSDGQDIDANFIVQSTGVADGYSLHELADGKIARLTNGEGNALRYGARYDLTADDGAAVNACIADSKAWNVTSSEYAGALTSISIVPVSDSEINLPEHFIVKLADNSDVELVKESTLTTKENIKIVGGIWDMNGVNQTRDDPGGYIGSCMELADINNLVIRDLTVKDPVSFGIQIGDIVGFEISNIKLDYDNTRNNMDGVHVNGGCSEGDIRNITGLTNDDFVALNARDGDQYQLRLGPITKVSISNIKSTGNSYRGVRLLSGGQLIDDITIDGIYGDYRFACVAITKYIFAEYNYGVIRLSRINGNMTADNEFMIQLEGVTVRSLVVDTMQRRLKNSQRGVLDMLNGSVINNLQINGITQSGDFASTALFNIRGYLRQAIISGLQYENPSNYHPLINVVSTGQIGQLVIRDVQADRFSSLLVNNGPIDRITFDNVNVAQFNSNPVLNQAGADIQVLNVFGGKTGNSASFDYILSTGTGSTILDINLSDAIIGNHLNIFSTASSGSISAITAMGCKFGTITLDFVSLAGAVDTVSITAFGNDLSGVTVYPIDQTGQTLRVNSPQLPIDRDLVTAPEDGDIVFNNDVGAAAIGLYTYYNGTWY